ncbi:RHS repeat-associated core domain-containing protein [Streptomyces massasporeus]|uniref:RHS repeat-associated core domain-containing protein n=1 Tax=Streptomyces massasporeus TaxID=67324 RepID=UPI00371158DB
MGVERGTTTEKTSQPYRLAGGFQDPTGLYHFSARYYDPNIGRFTNPDPLRPGEAPLPLRRMRPSQPHRPERHPQPQRRDGRRGQDWGRYSRR